MKSLCQPKNLVVLASLSIVVMMSGCANAAPTPTALPPTLTSTTLSVSGSGEVWPVLQAVEPKFAADVPGYHLNILSGFGTDAGADAVIKGQLDIATMNRAPTDDQAKKGVGYTKFGTASVVVIVNPNVTVDSLTIDQVKAIYSGDITNWSKLGGADLPIIVYNRGGTGGSVGSMKAAVFGNMTFVSTAQTSTTQEEMRTSVSQTPGSIGFGAWSAILASGTKVKALSINGIKPDDPTYPILEDVGVGYLVSNQAKIQPLLDWLKSTNGQTALKAYGVFTSK